MLKVAYISTDGKDLDRFYIRPADDIRREMEAGLTKRKARISEVITSPVRSYCLGVGKGKSYGLRSQYSQSL